MPLETLLAINFVYLLPLPNIKIQPNKISIKCFVLVSFHGLFCIFIQVLYKEKSILKAF